MYYFQFSKLSVVLFLILIYLCDGSVRDDVVPVIVPKSQDLNSHNSHGHATERRYSRQESSSTLAPPESISGESCNDDLACLSMASHDRLGLEAIRTLHRQLDDDANGVIELSESDEFLREELKYDDGAEKRQKVFHKNDDMYVSVKELWDAWVKSEVHNWTVEQTAEWLSTSVELPQYVPIFILNRVTGAQLPRLAVSNMHFLTNVLGIKDPIHKQKITLKAMDVVLFGPPKDSTSHIKDYILGTLILIALTVCWYVYRQKESSQQHLRRMMRDMEGLQKAELDLANLQKELERAKQEQESVQSEKISLERRLQEQALQGDSSDSLKTSFSALEVSQLKQEIELLRNELQRAEGELEDRCWSPPPGLQHWLQLTHEIENKAYVKKKVAAEKQLQQAREACEKLRKKRSSLVGAFVSTHGKSIDDVDRSIVEARTSLSEVTQELAERVHRWKQIELMCGFNIINNSGLACLENILYRNTPNGKNLLKSRMNSQDDLDDDTNSNYSMPLVTDRGGYESTSLWRDSHDSSSSEKQEEDFSEDYRSSSGVQFVLGGETVSQLPHLQSQNEDQKNLVGDSRRQLYQHQPTSLSRSVVDPQSSGGVVQRPTRLLKSYSEDFGENIDVEIERQLAKIQASQSDNSFDLSNRKTTTSNNKSTSTTSISNNNKRPKSKPKRFSDYYPSQALSSSLVTSTTPEEETHSTDSSSASGIPIEFDNNLDDLKKTTKRHKIHFPKFTKKSIRISSNPKIQPT